LAARRLELLALSAGEGVGAAQCIGLSVGAGHVGDQRGGVVEGDPGGGHVQRPAAGGPPMLGRRARAMYDMLSDAATHQRQPWARIHAADGPYWLATATYLDAHLNTWQWAMR